MQRDVLTLRFRAPGDSRFRKKASRFRASRNEKRVFFEWARKFLFSGGEVDPGWKPVRETDAALMQPVDQDISLGEAVARYLHDCRAGNAWMAPKARSTLEGQTAPVLQRFVEEIGADRPLASVERDAIAAFVRSFGGRRSFP